MSSTEKGDIAQLESATAAFDHLFSNQIDEARRAFSEHESPFHIMGLGVCAFLEAALGMEVGLMAEASRCLALAEAGAKKQAKAASGKSQESRRFEPGLEWEILQADAVVLLGLTYALSESYMGYAQCVYALNSAHSKFTKLFKTVFPNGLDNYSTPATTPKPSRKPSIQSIASQRSATSSTSKFGLFGRWGSTLTVPSTPTEFIDGPVEELIVAGTAFGFGLFNLVFSMMPAGVRGVAGLFGFKGDRKLALQALAVAAAKKDVHSVFAGLVLMTYHGVVLLLGGYQANEEHIIKQYQAIVDSIESRYPSGALWILNRAKILRMSNNADGAILALRAGLAPERPHSFAQADTLLVFELAWTLLSQRRYQESADMFFRLTELNSWSHATYYYIAAGCYFSLANFDKAQELFNSIPALLEGKKIGGKDLPTEVFIRKKLAFFKEKQKRRGGDEAQYVQAIKISPAEEIAIFWNTHNRIDKAAVTSHIDEWSALSPAVTADKPDAKAAENASLVDLDTSDELALRSLLLGIVNRSGGDYTTSRIFLTDAHQRHSKVVVSTWIGGISLFEMAVLDLQEAVGTEKAGGDPAWDATLKIASGRLDQALALGGKSVDLSSRLDSRILMLKDEIANKRGMLGIA